MSNQANQISEEVVIVSQEMVYAQDKASADIQVSTAHAYPRNITRAVNDAIVVVTMDQETAETCTYAVPRGGKTISGPSVHLAKILAQSWGNLRVDAKVVSVDPTTITSESVCWDLEKNLAIKVQVKRSIMTKYGRMNEDMITVTGNAANAIALRNSILNVIPRAVIDKVYKAAQGAIVGDVSSEVKLAQRRKMAVQRFKEVWNVEEKELLAVVGKNSVDLLTTEDIVVLVGIDTALKNGDTTIDQAFKRSDAATTTGTPNGNARDSERLLMELKKDTITLSILEKLEPQLAKFPEHTEFFNKTKNRLIDAAATKGA